MEQANLDLGRMVPKNQVLEWGNNNTLISDQKKLFQQVQRELLAIRFLSYLSKMTGRHTVFWRIVHVRMVNDGGCSGIKALESTSKLSPEDILSTVQGWGEVPWMM
jgi:hypothetical protein